MLESLAILLNSVGGVALLVVFSVVILTLLITSFSTLLGAYISFVRYVAPKDVQAFYLALFKNLSPRFRKSNFPKKFRIISGSHPGLWSFGLFRDLKGEGIYFNKETWEDTEICLRHWVNQYAKLSKNFLTPVRDGQWLYKSPEGPQVLVVRYYRHDGLVLSFSLSTEHVGAVQINLSQSFGMRDAGDHYPFMDLSSFCSPLQAELWLADNRSFYKWDKLIAEVKNGN